MYFFAHMGVNRKFRACLAGAVLSLSLAITLPAGEVLAQAGSEQDSSSREYLELELRSGEIFQLDTPAAAVFVADPAIADVQAHSPSMFYAFAKQTGKTTIYAVDADETIVFQKDIIVTHPVGRLNDILRDTIGPSAVKATSIDTGLVLTGIVKSAEAARDAEEIAQRFLGDAEIVLNRIDIQSPNQVNLRVRVAEISRDADKILGVNWDAALSTGDSFFSFLSGRNFLSNNRSNFTRFVDQSGAAGGLLGGFANDSFALDGMIDALEREGLVAVLAEPNLTALSGETASFLAGGEFPVPVGRDDNEVEIQFKEFGVRLSFTPTVLSSNRISLKVKPEVSDLDFANAIELVGTLIPALRTRRAETTVELGTGQSFAIGGLISNSTQNNVEKLPGLGDVPILGPLFRSTSFQRSESELVIIVTPYLVRPVRAAQLADPTENYRAPTDLERILDGRIARPSIKEGIKPPKLSEGGRLIGPAGFLID